MSDLSKKDKRPGGPRIRIFVIIPEIGDDSLREAMDRFIDGNIWSQAGPTFEGDWYRPVIYGDPYRHVVKARDLAPDLREIQFFVFDDRLYTTRPREEWEDQSSLDDILLRVPDYYVHTVYAYADEDCECFYGSPEEVAWSAVDHGMALLREVLSNDAFTREDKLQQLESIIVALNDLR